MPHSEEYKKQERDRLDHLITELSRWNVIHHMFFRSDREFAHVMDAIAATIYYHYREDGAPDGSAITGPNNTGA